MKNKIIVACIFLLMFFLVGFIDDKFKLIGKTICLDAGHGGKDRGAIYDGIYESNVNLQIVLKLQEKLSRNGSIVILTRSGDYDLSLPNALYRKRSDLLERSILINKSDCDFYISIHLNADVSSKWSGAQVFYDNNNIKNIKYAEIMQNQLGKDLKSSRKFKLLKGQYMNSRINIPGILIEAGFLSNASERMLLTSGKYQYKIINSIYNGILNF